MPIPTIKQLRFLMKKISSRQGSKTFGNLEPGSPNAIFEFQEFEMQFLEAKFFFVGAIKMK